MGEGIGGDIGKCRDCWKLRPNILFSIQTCGTVAGESLGAYSEFFRSERVEAELASSQGGNSL